MGFELELKLESLLIPLILHLNDNLMVIKIPLQCTPLNVNVLMSPELI